MKTWIKKKWEKKLNQIKKKIENDNQIVLIIKMKKREKILKNKKREK